MHALTISPAVQMLGVVLAFALAQPVYADVLLSANGERLVGRFIKEKNGIIYFNSDSLGRIKVSAEKMRIERTADAQQPAIANQADPQIESAEAKWNAELSGKISIDRGSLQTPEDRLDITTKVERKTPNHELYSTVSYNYKNKNDVVDDDDWLISISDDKFLNEEHFIAARFLATQEKTTEGFDQTQTLSAAYGWRLWETPEHYLRIGPALGYLSLARSDGEFNGPAVGIYGRALWPIFQANIFSAELQALDSLSDGSYVNLEMRLRRSITKHFFMGVAWNYSWSDVELESGITSKWRWDFGWQLKP